MHQWLTRVDVNVSDNTRIFARYNLQTETQNFPVGLWWRNANQVPYPTAVTAPNRSHSSTVSLTHVFGPSLTSESTFARDLHRLPEPVRGSEPRLALGARLHQPRHLRQRPRPDPVADRLGQRADDVQPGRLRPGPVRQEVADLRRAERDEGQRRAHDEGRRLLRVGQQQPAGQRRLERPPGSRARGPPAPPATTSRTCSPASSPSTASSRRTSSATWPTTSSRATSRTAGRRTNRLTIDGGLRLSHLGGWYERNGVGMAVFDPGALQLAGAGHDVPRPHVDGHQPRRPDVGRRGAERLLSRRASASPMTCSGDGSTLLRGGYGMFNFHDAQGPYSGFIDLPYGVTFTNVDQQSAAVATSRTSIRTRSPASAARSSSTDDKQPRTQSWSFTVQRRLPYQMTIEAGYVGSKSDRLLNDGINNLNIVPFGAMLNDPTGDPNHYRPLPRVRRTCRCRSTRTTRTTTRCRCCSAGRARSSATPRRTRGRRRSASAAAARGRRRSRRATSAIRPTACSATTARTC